MKKIIWTKEEEKYFIKNYSDLSNKELSKILNKSIYVIKSKSHSLKLKKSKEYFVNMGYRMNSLRKNTWTKEQENYLINNYSDLSNEELSKKLNRTIKSIKSKSYKLNLEKSKDYKNNNKIIRDSWTKEQEKYLINNYSDLSNEELSKILMKSINSIYNKSHKLELKKSKEHKSRMIGKRNKMVGRDLSYETLKNIAKKYKSRGEFQKYDSSAYTISRVKGYLDSICSHMVKCQFSIPQLILSEIIKIIINNEIIYDTRKIIKPYELDIYIPKYNLAFEYDGKGWHLNNRNDEIKNDLCIKKNIKLIRIIENNRDYTSDIKTQLINKLDEINDYCKLNIQKEDILDIDDNMLNNTVNKNILNIDEIKIIISKYDNYHIFIKNEHKLHDKLKRMKMLYLTKDLKRNYETWTDEKIKNEISKYEYLLDFIKNSYGCYLHIKRNGLENMLKNLKRKGNYIS
jgi:hypothetical protein